MVACLRSARFIYPDNSASIFVELRRVQLGKEPKFLVSRRFDRNMLNKSFGTLPEARIYWRGEVAKLTDQGLRRCDSQIAGFHEED